MRPRPAAFAPAVCALTLNALAVQSQAQTEAKPPQAPPTYGVEAAAVVIDAVVRDRKGQIVKDLTSSDFEVYEDGVRQNVVSFSVIARGGEAEAPPAETPGPPTVARLPAAASAPGAAPSPSAASAAENDAPSMIAFLFDRLSPQSRKIAYESAASYLKMGHRAGDVVGVFSIDLSLHTLQDFTTDPELIRTALARGGGAPGTALTSARDESQQLQSLQSRTEEAESRATQGGSGPGASQAAQAAGQALAGGAAAERTMAEIRVRMLRTFESLEREQQGYASTRGLLAVVKGLERGPGRKTVVYFSEGLAIPPNVQSQFRSVIHAANRANVSIYTMDAAGLRAESPTDETRREMAAAAERRLRLIGREDTAGSVSRMLEFNEDLLRLNPQSSLGQLADQTGGVRIRDTNDARASFRQIAQDMRFHYVLGYTPSNPEYDGRFRAITLKVRRPGLEVHSRKGYFAVPPGESRPLLDYEAPAIAQLVRSPRPDRFPIRAAGLSFPQRERPGRVPVMVEVPGSAIAFAPPAENKGRGADLAVVVRIKNEFQQEVQRLSQHYLLTADDKKLENARRGDVLFYREADLPPGLFTVEAVAYDAVARAASVRTFTVDVPPADETRPRLSSLVLVKRAERISEEERKSGNPLNYGETLLYPSLGEPFHKSSGKALVFYFTVYVGRDVPAPAKALIEVLDKGRPVGRVETDLPAPDANGLIQHAGGIPLSNLGLGSYELRVTLRQGPTLMARTAPFIVEE